MPAAPEAETHDPGLQNCLCCAQQQQQQQQQQGDILPLGLCMPCVDPLDCRKSYQAAAVAKAPPPPAAAAAQDCNRPTDTFCHNCHMEFPSGFHTVW
eukprot:jgi/Chrzof1/14069/Cz08g24020.t1